MHFIYQQTWKVQKTISAYLFCGVLIYSVVFNHQCKQFIESMHLFLQSCMHFWALLIFSLQLPEQDSNGLVAKLKLIIQYCECNLQLSLRVNHQERFTFSPCKQNYRVLFANEILESLPSPCIHDNEFTAKIPNQIILTV